MGEAILKGTKKPRPYSSSTFEVSKRMLAPGQSYFEEQAIVYDLISRIGSLKSTLPYYDRTMGKPIADEIAELRREAMKRLEDLPEGAMRQRYEREIWA
jgi:hypothetical protein